MEEFDRWNEVKKKTEKTKRIITLKPREIWWVKIGKNIGSEEYGKNENFTRPVVVIRRLTRDLVLVVPTTTKTKEDNDYFHTVSFFEKVKQKKISVSVMILQLRVISIKRILNKIGIIDKGNFRKIQEKLVKIVGPTL